MLDVRTVQIGPFSVADASRRQAVDHVVDLALGAALTKAVKIYALHVGGLNCREDLRFVEAMNAADFVYADGGSVVWLGRHNGAVALERASTTDVGGDILRELAVRLGRPPRVALVGGPPGLAKRAAAALQRVSTAEPVLVQHGFHQDWDDHVERLAASGAEVVLVGMGVPGEMLWSHKWADRIGQGVILTCGGWFGFLAGEERRAPSMIRRPGLEWISRVAQQPVRLGPRYVRGAVSTATLARHAQRADVSGRALQGGVP